MSTMIICAGSAPVPESGNYDSAGFDAAVLAGMESPCPPYDGRKYNPAGKSVLIGEGRPALDTAEKLLLPCEWTVDPLLNEIPVRSFTDTDKTYAVRHWLRKAAVQRKHGDPRQPESTDAVIARTNRLIAALSGRDAILITYPLFLAVLLDRLRVHNYVIQRTGISKIQPLERFLISAKEEHCGGCQHNCFLSSPGCGIGRDKAMRRGMQYRESSE